MPHGDGWLHELKYDGYRIEARKAGDEVTLFSRSGLDWTVRFPAIAKAILTLPCETALIDGEAAYVLPSGLTDFKSLQDNIDSPDPAIRYFAFDLLFVDGKDLRKSPLIKRKAKLHELMAANGVSDFLVYSDHVVGSGQAFYDQASAAGLEGVMSKKIDAPYRSGRGKDWLKIKCTKGEEFVIGGYSRSDVRGKPFSSLLLGTFEDGKLIYSGKVGTGFDTSDWKVSVVNPSSSVTSARRSTSLAWTPDRSWRSPVTVTHRPASSPRYAPLSATSLPSTTSGMGIGANSSRSLTTKTVVSRRVKSSKCSELPTRMRVTLAVSEKSARVSSTVSCT